MPLQCKKCGGPHLTIKCGKNNSNRNNNMNNSSNNMNNSSNNMNNSSNNMNNSSNSNSYKNTSHRNNMNNSNRNNFNRNNSNMNNFNRNNSDRNNSDRNNSDRNNFNRNREKFCVRMSNIPDDLTIRELSELLLEWGDVGKINFNNNIKYKAAYIDFNIKEEAEYFVEALHKTPFDTFIIDVELLEKK
jgi:hypothetical protein